MVYPLQEIVPQPPDVIAKENGFLNSRWHNWPLLDMSIIINFAHHPAPLNRLSADCRGKFKQAAMRWATLLPYCPFSFSADVSYNVSNMPRGVFHMPSPSTGPPTKTLFRVVSRLVLMLPESRTSRGKREAKVAYSMRLCGGNHR